MIIGCERLDLAIFNSSKSFLVTLGSKIDFRRLYVKKRFSYRSQKRRVMNDAILNLGTKMVFFRLQTNEIADKSKMVRINPLFGSQNETADKSNADKSGCG